MFITGVINITNAIIPTLLLIFILLIDFKLVIFIFLIANPDLFIFILVAFFILI